MANRAAAGDLAKTGGRLPGLDLLRAGAITLVMAQHATELLLQPSEAVHQALHLGRFGVDLFFALSGFLVGGIVLQAGEALAQPRVVAGFLASRWLRTLPLYYLILAVRLGLRHFVYHVPLESWRTLGAYATFTQNFASPMPAYFVESWSLAVEEWFYVLLPFLVWLALRAGLRGGKALVLGALALLIVPTLLRIVAAAGAGQSEATIHVVVYRLDAIAWGVLAAWLAQARPELWQRIRYPALLAALGLVIGSYVWLWVVTRQGSALAPVVLPSGVGLGMALLLPWAASADGLRHFRWMKPVEQVARWSYAIYLTNLLLAGIMFMHVVAPRPAAGLGERLLWVALFWGATYAFSAALHYGFELPLLRLRERVGVYRSFKQAARR